MYESIGKKIKRLATIVCIIEVVAAIIYGKILLSNYTGGMQLIGLLVLFVGPFVAWIFSWFVYAYGELVDKACDIAKNTYDETKPEIQMQVKQDRINKIEKLYSKKLITEEEYRQALSKKAEGDMYD